MNFWQRNKVWIALSILLTALFALVVILTGDEAMSNLISGTAYTGIAFLMLVLIPGNVLKLQIPRLKDATPFLARLSRYRRSFGIISGLLFVAHAASVIVSARLFTGFYPEKAFFIMKAVIPGTISLIIMILLLLTSNRFAKTHLGKSWKPLQSLIWISVPLMVAHSFLMTTEIELPVALAFGSTILLIIAECWIYAKRPPIDTAAYKRHLWLTITGLLIAAAVVILMK
jgi:DMSO/TMAO reductase YedYZ heme-binding membrane subunit